MHRKWGDEQWMQRCIDLALLANYETGPNPMVGCVVVKNNQVLTEGWHQRAGHWHAERMALAKLGQEVDLSDSTLYVNLEPCSHHGRTPPCADLLIERKLGRVVVGMRDPNPLVSGTGIKRLQQAGIEVECGVLEATCKHLNRAFCTAMEKKRPHVSLKWAQTADGFIARADGSSQWISSATMRALAHKLRSMNDGVLVGTGTLAKDKPTLNRRDWPGKQPYRIYIDRLGAYVDQIPMPMEKVLVVTDKEIELPSINIWDNGARAPIEELLNQLNRLQIRSLLVEGGAKLLTSFLEAGLWDEAYIITNTGIRFGSGIAAPSLPLASNSQMFGQEQIYYFTNPRAISLI